MTEDQHSIRAGFDPFAVVTRAQVCAVNAAVSPRATVLWIVLRSYAGAGEQAWPKQKRLAADLGIDEGTVRRCLTELREHALIGVAPRLQGGRKAGNEYTICDPALRAEMRGAGATDRADVRATDRAEMRGADRAETRDRRSRSTEKDQGTVAPGTGATRGSAQPALFAMPPAAQGGDPRVAEALHVYNDRWMGDDASHGHKPPRGAFPHLARKVKTSLEDGLPWDAVWSVCAYMGEHRVMPRYFDDVYARYVREEVSAS